MSNYNYGLEPGIQRNGSSRLRFVLIFLAVSALTAALLWWFWPGKDEENSEKKESVPSVTSSETQTLQPVVKEPEITPAPAPAPAAPQPVEKDPQKQDGKKSGETGVSADKKNDPADPPLPEKGVITPADKEGADLPAIPVDSALSEEQEKAFQQAETLFAANDFAGAEKNGRDSPRGSCGKFRLLPQGLAHPERCQDRNGFQRQKKSLCGHISDPQRRQPEWGRR